MHLDQFLKISLRFLKFYMISKFNNLINKRAKTDFIEPERMKSLVEEIKQTRLMKITNFIKSLHRTDTCLLYTSPSPRD